MAEIFRGVKKPTRSIVDLMIRYPSLALSRIPIVGGFLGAPFQWGEIQAAEKRGAAAHQFMKLLAIRRTSGLPVVNTSERQSIALVRERESAEVANYLRARQRRMSVLLHTAAPRRPEPRPVTRFPGRFAVRALEPRASLRPPVRLRKVA